MQLHKADPLPPVPNHRSSPFCQPAIVPLLHEPDGGASVSATLSLRASLSPAPARRPSHGRASFAAPDRRTDPRLIICRREIGLERRVVAGRRHNMPGRRAPRHYTGAPAGRPPHRPPPQRALYAA